MSKANKIELLMLDLINQERKEAGLDRLKLEKDLNEAADDHSSWMLKVDQLTHTGKNGSSAGDRMEDAGFDFTGSWSWGENVAYQTERGKLTVKDDVRDLHEALMQSPGHRANILSDDFEFVGIGIKVGDFNGRESVIVTQNFGKTDASVNLDPGGQKNGAALAKQAEPDDMWDPTMLTLPQDDFLM
ncbi:CAP domain-containing protein [Thalassococcus sp. S3]|uniref:CAP domain-containing protein n=1 Tax=Thalassococcus sp. S3 TaxID=2017482 RepID=UPI00102419A9|nr:CAP domain-containing protein [Thalassococcus sp. S3]QBF31673.1 hypothetical protein CFI11_10650 [Thalassococcus sp. S3]